MLHSEEGITSRGENRDFTRKRNDGTRPNPSVFRHVVSRAWAEKSTHIWPNPSNYWAIMGLNSYRLGHVS